jgi:hypothetical protein
MKSLEELQRRQSAVLEGSQPLPREMPKREPISSISEIPEDARKSTPAAAPTFAEPSFTSTATGSAAQDDDEKDPAETVAPALEASA